MFVPDCAAGCPHCSAIADGFNGFVVHLPNHEVMHRWPDRAPLGRNEQAGFWLRRHDEYHQR